MSGLLHRSLNDEERMRLTTWQHSGRTSRFIRARILLLAACSPSAAAIAWSLGVHVQTVREILREFSTRVLDGLEAKPRSGRPCVFDETAADRLIALLHERPEEHGGDDGRWTLATAAAALAKELKVTSISTDTVRRLLKQGRHSWQRAKEWIESPDPAYAFRKDGATG